MPIFVNTHMQTHKLKSEEQDVINTEAWCYIIREVKAMGREWWARFKSFESSRKFFLQKVIALLRNDDDQRNSSL